MSPTVLFLINMYDNKKPREPGSAVNKVESIFL